MSGLAEELAAYAAMPTEYRWAPKGRKVLADLFAACPSLRALVEAAGVDPDAAVPERRRSARWTEAEERALSEMYWAGEPVDAMAARLGRSASGVRCRLGRLGLYLGDRREKKEGS